MSLYRAKDELTRDAIKHILNALADSGRLNARQLVSAVNSEFSNRQLRALGRKGGDIELKRLIHYLKARGYLNYVYGRGERAVYHLSTTGWRRLDELKHQPLEDRVQKWDGKWRVLVFDIPEHRRSARDSLRRLIKQLGFIQMQRSVWIQPLPCEQEITEIKRAYGLDEHSLTLFVVDSFDGEGEYRKVFASKLRPLH